MNNWNDVSKRMPPCDGYYNISDRYHNVETEAEYKDGDWIASKPPCNGSPIRGVGAWRKLENRDGNNGERNKEDCEESSKKKDSQ